MKEKKNKSEIKAEVKLICGKAGHCHSKQKKYNYYVHGRELPFKTEKVKLICSWPGTAVQKRNLRLLAGDNSLNYWFLSFFFFERQFPAMNRGVA